MKNLKLSQTSLATAAANQFLKFESEMQRRAFILLGSSEGVRSTVLRPNYKVRYVEKNGQVAYQTFDVHSEFVNGKSVATAVMSLSKYAKAKHLTRLEAGQLVREDGTLGRLSEAFTWMTIVSEEWVNRCYESPGCQAHMIASGLEI